MCVLAIVGKLERELKRSRSVIEMIDVLDSFFTRMKDEESNC